MGSTIKCHLLTKAAGMFRITLRRFAWSANGDGAKCSASGYGYHDAENAIADRAQMPPDAKGHNATDDKEECPVSYDDPRWPKTCACGYEFKDADAHQYNEVQLWTRDTGEVVTLRDAQPGDMWLADWYPQGFGSVHHKERGGGPHLIVMCPGKHHWDVDSKSSNGSGWTRTGEPPNVTATPSIGVHKPPGQDGYAYHGFLTNGALVEC